MPALLLCIVICFKIFTSFWFVTSIHYLRKRFGWERLSGGGGFMLFRKKQSNIHVHNTSVFSFPILHGKVGVNMALVNLRHPLDHVKRAINYWLIAQNGFREIGNSFLRWPMPVLRGITHATFIFQFPLEFRLLKLPCF